MNGKTGNLFNVSRLYQASINAIAALEQLSNCVNIYDVDETTDNEVRDMINKVEQLKKQSWRGVMAIQRNDVFPIIAIRPESTDAS